MLQNMNNQTRILIAQRGSGNHFILFISYFAFHELIL